MRLLLIGKLQGPGILSSYSRNSKLHRGLVAVRAVGIEPFAAGEQSREPRRVREKRPDFGGRCGQTGRARDFQALPRALSMARVRARRVNTRAISRRYSAEACRSESGSIPCP